MLMACMLTTNLSATYYIAGNGSDDSNGHWCNGSNWGFNALSGENSITFEGVAAGNYGFKIKDADNWDSGSEYTTIDYDNSDSPMYGGDGSDVSFTLSEEADVTVSVADGKVRVHATKPLAYKSSYYYIAGNVSAFGEWSENTVSLTNDQITFPSLDAGWYEFKITNGTWSKTWGYSELDAVNSSPMHKTYGDGTNICFRLQAAADVTVRMLKGKVVLLIDRELIITGNGDSEKRGDWCAGGNWSDATANSAAKLDANNAHTYLNLPPEAYEFKIKENVAGAWNDDCTWGYDHLDPSNSNTGESRSGNIGFDLNLPADVSIAIVNNQIRLNTSPVYFIAGNGDASHGTWCNQKGWWQDEPNSRLDAATLSKTYTSLPAGEYEFKLTNGRWADAGGTVWAASAVDLANSSKGYMGSGETGNIKFHLQAPTDVTVSFNPETDKISIVSSNGYFLCNVYSVVGQTELVGFNWANDETSTEMTDMGDGTYQYTISDKHLEAGDYEYKIIGGHSWGAGCEYPASNATLSITETGTYNVVFTLNPATGAQTCIATPASLPSTEVTISAYKFSTFFSDKAYSVPSGLQAFVLTDIDEELLMLQAVNPIPANTGVVLYGAANANYTLTETTTEDTYPSNLLKGSVSEQLIDNSKVHYILSLNSSDEIGFFWPFGTTDGIGSFTNHAGKAYIELGPSAAPARMRGFVLKAPDSATGLHDTDAEQTDNAYYDLLGRKFDYPQQSGIYIHQGKKVVVHL